MLLLIIYQDNSRKGPQLYSAIFPHRITKFNKIEPNERSSN